MPSPFPRLTMVVTPEQHQLLARLAALQGRSAASYVRGLLDLAMPHLRKLAAHLEELEALENAQDEALQRHIADQLDDADRDLEEQLSLLDIEDLDEALEPERPPAAEARTDAPPPGRPRLAVANDHPPSSNTGVSSC